MKEICTEIDHLNKVTQTLYEKVGVINRKRIWQWKKIGKVAIELNELFASKR